MEELCLAQAVQSYRAFQSYLRLRQEPDRDTGVSKQRRHFAESSTVRLDYGWPRVLAAGLRFHEMAHFNRCSGGREWGCLGRHILM